MPGCQRARVLQVREAPVTSETSRIALSRQPSSPTPPKFLIGWQDDWTNRVRRALPEGAGEELACPLMQRLAGLGIPTLVVAQYEPVGDPGEQHDEARLVLDCAAASGLATLDTFDAVSAAVREHGVSGIYLNGHHTARGNRIIAGRIATELARRGMLR